MKNSIEQTQALTVALRIRPMNSSEINCGSQHIAHVMDGKLVVLRDPNEDADDILRANRSREKQYVFDLVFGPQATHRNVYESTASGLLGGVLDGYNATVFAYGPTGTGKTFTMLGTSEEPGIMYLTLNELYGQIDRKAEDMTYKVTISYLEIYNEMIRDLLHPNSGILDMREDSKGVVVVGLLDVEVTSASQVMSLLSLGNSRRTCEPTAVNKTSSRSHAVLQITVEGKGRVGDVSQEVSTGKLYMVDLAGSERASQTKNRGKRMIEGAHINRSLLALGNCINALGGSGKVQYVNYRDSKLTRILKDSLGGNCRTVMIAHVSPASKCFEESHNTLRYAERAKHIKTKIHANIHDVSYHIIQYTNIIADLRREIEKLKAKLSSRTVRKESNQSIAITQEREDLFRELKDLLQEQQSSRRELFTVECAIVQNALDTNRSRLQEDHLGSEAEGEDPGTATEGENDLTISVSNLGSRDSDTSEGGHAATKMRQTLPISRLKVEQKKLLSQQRTLQRAFEHLKTRALDSYERLSDIVMESRQKGIIEQMMKINDLEIQTLNQNYLSARTGLYLQDRERLIEQLMEQNQNCLELVKRQRLEIKDQNIEYPKEMDSTFLTLVQHHRYLSDWFSMSATLSNAPSEAHLTDAGDGDDEASTIVLSPLMQERMTLGEPDRMLSSLASLTSVRDSITLIEQDGYLSNEELPTGPPTKLQSHKATKRSGTSGRSTRIFLDKAPSRRHSDVSEDDSLPSIKLSSKVKGSTKLKNISHKPTSFPSATSPPTISVSRCSSLKASGCAGTRQLMLQTDTSHSLSTTSVGAGKGRKTRSKKKKHTLDQAPHRGKSKHHVVTAKDVLQSSPTNKDPSVASPLPPPDVKAQLKRRERANANKRLLTLGLMSSITTNSQKKDSTSKRGPAPSPYLSKSLPPALPRATKRDNPRSNARNNKKPDVTLNLTGRGFK